MADEPRRGPGRPPSGQSPITPEVLQLVAQFWTEGESVHAIAEAVGVHPDTIWHHINRTIRPRWREYFDQQLVDEIAKINDLERIARREFKKSESVLTEQTLREGIEKGAEELGPDTSLFDDVGDGLRIVERITKKVKRLANPTWLNVIQWCIELRLKIGGHLAGEKMETDHSLRVAGLTPDELDRKMFDRFMDHLAARGRIIEAPKKEKPE